MKHYMFSHWDDEDKLPVENLGVEIIRLSFTENNSNNLSDIRIRVKIKDKYYVGHLELSE